MTTTQPLVSILIPCYNSALFIAETLDSVIAQTYTNWESIVVDDHSSDNSIKIIEKYYEQYPDKIKLFTNPQKGACSARNYAFKKSKGDYIQYLDADDLLTPNKLEIQIALFLEYGINTITNCKWGRFTNYPKEVKWEQQSTNRDYDNPIDWLTDSWMGKGMAANSSWLTPRQLIEQAGPWNESLTINQDGEFFTRVLINAEAIMFSENEGVYYRSGQSDSISQQNSQSKEKAESLLKSYQSYERVLTLKDTENIRKALGNNYLNFIYRFYNVFPELTAQAEKYFWNLGLKKMWPLGGTTFRQVSRIVGFKNALKLKSILKQD